ncbi:hypothetical protein CAL7716_074380 [Calothrix sp. PCC 7716]|nr:hypothetical protein CAL7716_074380 [Calothrix sp. PCC 7716]
MGKICQGSLKVFHMNINDWQVLANSPLGKLLENNNQAFWVCSADLSQIVYTSPTYEKIFGRQMTNFNEGAKSFLDAIYTEDKQRIDIALQSLIQGTQLDEEYRIVRPDGQVRWIHNRAFASLDISGNIQYITGIAEDVNDRKVASLNLVADKEKYLQLFDNLDVVFWVSDSSVSECYYISPGYEKIWGRSCAEIYANPKSFGESVHPDDRERVFTACFGEDNCGIEQEYRIIRPDGEVRWVRQRTKALLNENGQLYRQVGTAEDITDKKMIELALKQSEQRFQQFANNVDIVFWVCEPDASKFYYINPGYEKIWGKSCEDIYQNPRSFIESVYPDDLERIIAAATGPNACNMDEEYRIIRPDGAVRWVRDQTFPVYDEQGNLFRMAGIAFDITERKQAETMLVQSSEQYRQLAENIGHVSWLITPDASQVLYISPNYEQVWGKSCASLYENSLSFIESILPEDKPKVFAAVEKDSTQMNVEYRIVRPNGTVRWIHARTYPIQDSSGNTFRVVGIAEDITLRKQAEEETLIALQRARELSDAKSNFIANTSHEIRTPLATIQSSIDMLQHYKDQLAEDKKEKHFQKIEAAVRRITQIVQDILLLSEAEANALQFQPCSTDIAKLCSDAIAMVVSFTDTQRNVELFISENAVNQAPVIDPKLVTYIITNLLDNALKYSNEDSKVKFSVDFTQNQLTFVVKDKGIGINNEDLPYIFDSFYRANNIGNIGGTGLGLAIVKQCVDLHKGEITVNSDIANGTTFTVTLPLSH